MEEEERGLKAKADWRGIPPAVRYQKTTKIRRATARSGGKPMSGTKQKQNDRRKMITRVFCIVMAALLILSSVAAIFGFFG